MLPIRNITYLLPMCCSFEEKCINSQKTGLGCSTPLTLVNCKIRGQNNLKISRTTWVLILKIQGPSVFFRTRFVFSHIFYTSGIEMSQYFQGQFGPVGLNILWVLTKF